MHWATYRRRKQALVALLSAQRLPEIREPVDVVYIRYSLRPMDWDNVAASAKIPFDVLTELGVLEDDNPAWIQSMLVEQRVVKTRVEQGFKVVFLGAEKIGEVH